MPDINIKIGGIVIALNSNEDQGNFSIPDNYSEFISTEKPDLEFQVHRFDFPVPVSWELAFKTGGAVSYYRDSASYYVSIASTVRNIEHDFVAAIKNNNKIGDIYDSTPIKDTGEFLFPLRYPVGEILIAEMLAWKRGLLLHACGIILDNRGMVFAGTSGAGKSTVAKLFLGQQGTTLLNDDRIILGGKTKHFRVYGTPFHGEVRQVCAKDAPLEKIFILNQAKKNRLIPLGPQDAAKALFVRSFPTFWNQAGMDFTLKFLEELVSSVPCYRLDFLPEVELLDFVK